jgi:hypothetical protein
MFSKGESLESAYPIIKETIPKSELGYGTNNKYPSFPPLMSDGRAIVGGWQPESTINKDLIESNGIKSNWEYRRYLTKNSKDIMEYNFRESANDVGYFKRPIDIPSIQSNLVNGIENTPYKYNSILDKSTPFGYETSDLKQLYLTREQLDARKVSPVVTQEYILAKQYSDK